MAKEIYVIVGNDDGATLDALYSANAAHETALILPEKRNVAVAPASRRADRTVYCYDAYASMMILLTGFDGYDRVRVALTSDEAKQFYADNEARYGERYVVDEVRGAASRPEARVRVRRALNRGFEKTKLDRLVYAAGKVYHTDLEQYIMKAAAKDIPKAPCEYAFCGITKDNYKEYFTDAHLLKETAELLKDGNTKCLAITDGAALVGKAFIKGRGSRDRMFRIKSENSYVITLIEIDRKYRGRGLQRALIGELADRFIENKDSSSVYAYVYTYNVPSLKNFERCGFHIVGRRRVRRFLKHTVGKEKI